MLYHIFFFYQYCFLHQKIKKSNKQNSSLFREHTKRRETYGDWACREERDLSRIRCPKQSLSFHRAFSSGHSSTKTKELMELLMPPHWESGIYYLKRKVGLAKDSILIFWFFWIFLLDPILSQVYLALPSVAYTFELWSQLPLFFYFKASHHVLLTLAHMLSRPTRQSLTCIVRLRVPINLKDKSMNSMKTLFQCGSCSFKRLTISLTYKWSPSLHSYQFIMSFPQT